jgi:hypothetical protein
LAGWEPHNPDPRRRRVEACTTAVPRLRACMKEACRRVALRGSAPEGAEADRPPEDLQKVVQTAIPAAGPAVAEVAEVAAADHQREDLRTAGPAVAAAAAVGPPAARAGAAARSVANTRAVGRADGREEVTRSPSPLPPAAVVAADRQEEAAAASRRIRLADSILGVSGSRRGSPCCGRR